MGYFFFMRIFFAEGVDIFFFFFARIYFRERGLKLISCGISFRELKIISENLFKWKFLPLKNNVILPFLKNRRWWFSMTPLAFIFTLLLFTNCAVAPLKNWFQWSAFFLFLTLPYKRTWSQTSMSLNFLLFKFLL